VFPVRYGLNLYIFSRVSDYTRSSLVFTRRCMVMASQWRLHRLHAHTAAGRNLPAATNRRPPTATSSPSRLTKNSCWFSLYSLGTGHIENTATNSYSIAEWLFVAAETCLPCRCRRVHVSSGSAIPALIRHVTILFRISGFQGLMNSKQSIGEVSRRFSHKSEPRAFQIFKWTSKYYLMCFFLSPVKA
jgi:hypothetical protein